MSEIKKINEELLDKVAGGVLYKCSCGATFVSSEPLGYCPNCHKPFGTHICEKHGIEKEFLFGKWICPKCHEEGLSGILG